MPSSRREIEVLLAFVDAKERISARESRHIIEAELLYPRVGIASKSTSVTQRLLAGIVDVRELPWYRRILFKENVEGRFALKFRVSRSLSQAAFDAAMRYVGAAVFGAVETTVDKSFGGVAGDVASSPFGYGKKQLLKTPATDYILEGGIDLDASQLEGTMQIEVPLFATANAYVPIASHAKGTRPEPRKLLYKEGQLLGKASMTLNVMDA